MDGRYTTEPENISKMPLKRHGILVSYLIGTPVGLFTILITFTLPVVLTGEGLATIAIVDLYWNAIIGLTVSFLIALGIGGYNASTDILKQKSLLKTSFRYSLTINAIIWTVFMLLAIFTSGKKIFWLILVPPVFAFIICTAITTFTLGLLICYIIRKKAINRT